MKKLLIIVGLIFVFPFATSASHGSSQNIDNIYYLSKSNEIIANRDDGVGMGAPFLLIISLYDNQKTELPLFKINEEGTLEKNKDTPEEEKIELERINLNELNLDFQFKFTGGNYKDNNEQILDRRDDYMNTSRYLSWQFNVLQNSNKKGSGNFNTCLGLNAYETINFEGFIIPDKKGLLVKVSSIANCIESAYPRDEIFWISTIDAREATKIDQDTYIENSFGENSDYHPDLICKTFGGIYTSLDASPYLNDIGFEAYEQENYKTAISYFELAFKVSPEDNPHLLSLYNSAATKAKIGNIEDSLRDLEKLLLDYPESTELYWKKVFIDEDFTELRKDEKFKEFAIKVKEIINKVFYDVDDKNPNYEAINYLKEQGIINGYADGSFKPDNTLNRAELLKILIEATISEEEKILLNPPLTKEEENTPLSERGARGDLEDNKYQNCFPDVNDEWFAPYICYAKEKGIVNGYADSTFKPNNTINFTEASKIIVNAMGIETEETDSDVWYEKYVKALAENKRIPRTITSFDKLLTRGEMAEVMWREKENIDYKWRDWISYGELELTIKQSELQKQNPKLVKIFLTLLNDDGKYGKQTGCGDSAVGVLTEINSNSNIELVKSTLEKLFLIKGDFSLLEDKYFKDYYEDLSTQKIQNKSTSSEDRALYDALKLSELKIENISIEDKVVKIHIIGPFSLAGDCCDTRFLDQIKETVLQFDFIKEAKICIYKQPIEEFANSSGKLIIENYCE